MTQQPDVIQISTDKLQVSRLNVRKDIGDLSPLIASIRSVGVLQPLLIRTEGKKYGIIVGSRRFEASKQVGLKEVPCIIKEMADAEALVESISENIQRNDLSIDEILNTYNELRGIDPETWTKSHFAKKVGMTPEWIGEVILANDCLTKLKEAGMTNISMNSRPSDDDRARGVFPIKHLREIERIINSPEMKEAFGERQLTEKRVELAKAVIDPNFNQKQLLRLMEVFRTSPRRPIPGIIESIKSESTREVLKNYLPKSIVKEIREVAMETKQPIFDVVPQIIKRGLEAETSLQATKEKLLKDTDFLREAAKTFVTSRVDFKPRKTKEVLILEQDKDEAMRTYHDIFQLLAVLREHMEIDNVPQEMRQKAWVNMVKHLSKDEISKLIYEYVETIIKEMQLIKSITLSELEQRRKELT